MFKSIVLITLFVSFCLACSGDCISCHKTLDYEKDTRHSPMNVCVTCHTSEAVSSIEMGSACGVDCFTCHDTKKLTSSSVSEHKIIKDCIACHSSLDKEGFTSKKQSMSSIPTAKDFFTK